MSADCARHDLSAALVMVRVQASPSIGAEISDRSAIAGRNIDSPHLYVDNSSAWRSLATFFLGVVEDEALQEVVKTIGFEVV